MYYLQCEIYDNQIILNKKNIYDDIIPAKQTSWFTVYIVFCMLFLIISILIIYGLYDDVNTKKYKSNFQSSQKSNKFSRSKASRSKPPKIGFHYIQYLFTISTIIKLISLIVNIVFVSLISYNNSGIVYIPADIIELNSLRTNAEKININVFFIVYIIALLIMGFLIKQNVNEIGSPKYAQDQKNPYMDVETYSKEEVVFMSIIFAICAVLFNIYDIIFMIMMIVYKNKHENIIKNYKQYQYMYHNGQGYKIDDEYNISKRINNVTINI